MRHGGRTPSAWAALSDPSACMDRDERGCRGCGIRHGQMHSAGLSDDSEVEGTSIAGPTATVIVNGAPPATSRSPAPSSIGGEGFARFSTAPMTWCAIWTDSCRACSTSSIAGTFTAISAKEMGESRLLTASRAADHGGVRSPALVENHEGVSFGGDLAETIGRLAPPARRRRPRTRPPAAPGLLVQPSRLRR